VKEIPEEELAEITWNNCLKIFNLKEEEEVGEEVKQE
jgi:hypothetical protein